MGLLKVDQVRNAAGTGNSDLYKQWAAKAWFHFSTVTTTTLRDSGNVASLVDNGVGNTTVNLTSALADVNYATSLGATPDTTIFSGDTAPRVSIVSNQTTSAVTLLTGYWYSVSGLADFPRVMGSVMKGVA